jgi:tetratricopeptide (TPR) repeat protein
MVITAQNFQNKKVTSQRDGSFALIEAMINQANPITNSVKKVDGDAMIKSLNELATNQAVLLESDNELSHFFYQKLGSLYHSKGLYDQSLQSYQTAFKSLQKFVDDDDDQYISTELTIAHLLESTGKFEQAQIAAENMLIKLDQLSNIDPRHRLNAYYLLSKVHQYQAENETSHDYGLKALTWIEKFPDVDSGIQASVYNSLAVTNRNMGEVELAETQYNKAIELLKPIKEKQLELSGILVNLAILKGRSGDMDASEKLFHEAFEIIKKIEENHPHLAMAYLPYSTLLQFTDRLDESENIIKEAIRMLTFVGEEKYLATAHMKYARIGLYKNNIDNTLEHVTKSYLLYKDITGLDHPIIFDLYNMALWVLLSEPYQEYGLRLAEIIANKEVETAVDSNAYRRFLVQQAILNKQTLELDFAEAVIPNYLFGQANQSKQVKQDWLAQMKEVYNGESDVIDAWLDINTAINANDSEAVQLICDNSSDWHFSSRLAIKVLIIQSCLENPEAIQPEIKATYQQILSDLNQTNDERFMLIQNLLQSMK